MMKTQAEFEAWVNRIYEKDQRRWDQELAKLPAGFKAVRLFNWRSSRVMLVTPAIEGGWRLTWCMDLHGLEPWGHAVFKTALDAVRSGLGFYGKGTYGPPHGSDGWTVAEAV